MEQGRVRLVNPVFLSWLRLESGRKVFWRDNVVNGLIRRMPLDESVEA